MMADEQFKAELGKIQNQVLRKVADQLRWKHEAIEKAIDVLTSNTHREKDMALKALLGHLKNMPEIQSWDVDLSSDEVPF